MLLVYKSSEKLFLWYKTWFFFLFKVSIYVLNRTNIFFNSFLIQNAKICLRVCFDRSCIPVIIKIGVRVSSERSSIPVVVSFIQPVWWVPYFGVHSSPPKLWNNLPFDIRNCDNIGEFKKLLKTVLFKLAFD